jgi:hypothetical protein
MKFEKIGLILANAPSVVTIWSEFSKTNDENKLKESLIRLSRPELESPSKQGNKSLLTCLQLLGVVGDLKEDVKIGAGGSLQQTAPVPEGDDV